jgi:hypothetical protein
MNSLAVRMAHPTRAEAALRRKTVGCAARTGTPKRPA